MRRRDVAAAVLAAAAAVSAGLYRFTDLFVKHYAPTPYDDLLMRLTDREQAAKLGAQLTGSFDITAQSARLRDTFRSQDLAAAAKADIAAGRLVEVEGWVLPETVALLSALASRV
ncbi:MAG TPA: hypothetical protein VIG39_08015 [Rhizomicrobium sp.]|jgi:hypothetical protein